MNYSGGSRGGALRPPPPSQSAVRKKTAVVHFTTIPFEPNTANYTLSHIFGGRGGGANCRCNSNISYPRFEVYKTFLCVFMRNFMVFMR